jgi:hypothetical protein
MKASDFGVSSVDVAKEAFFALLGVLQMYVPHRSIPLLLRVSLFSLHGI